MNKTKVTYALMLSSMLALTACGSSSTQPTAKGGSPDPNAGKSAASASPAGPLVKYDTPVEVTTVRSADATVKFAGSDTIDNNEWTRAYLDDLGIKLKYNWIATSGDEFTQKMNVMIASGDIPDIVPVTSIQLKQLVDAGMLADLTSVFDKYASPLTKSFMTEGGPEQLDSARFGGKLMAIPNTNASIDGSSILWVRTDWLKKLNLPAPKTMDDVLKIADAFAKQDPDGNGKNDTFGLGINKGIGGGGIMGLGGYFNGFHAYMGSWVKDASGNIVYGSVQPEMKPALLKLQEMYKAGLIDKEFGVKDGAKTGEDAVAGKIGLYYGAMWNPIAPLQNGKNLNPNMEWEAFPIVSVDSAPAKPQVGLPIYVYYAVRKDSKHPEALMNMINLFIKKGTGSKEDAEKYMNSKDGLELFKHAPFNASSSRQNLDNYLAILNAQKTGDASKLSIAQTGIYDNIKKFKAGDNKFWNQDRVFGEVSSYRVIDQYVNQKLPLMNAFFGAPTKTMGDKKATLDKMEIETFTKIIMGDPIDSFDKFVSDWKKLGGEDMTKEVNDWAKAMK